MQSLLDAPRYQTLAPADRIMLGKAEDAAHDSAIALFDELKRALPEELRRFAPNAVFVGLFTALHRIIAETQEPQLALMVTQGLARISEVELAHWQEGAYADVRR